MEELGKTAQFKACLYHFAFPRVSVLKLYDVDSVPPQVTAEAMELSDTALTQGADVVTSMTQWLNGTNLMEISQAEINSQTS